MANNYFGFAPGGTQYSAQATAYPAAASATPGAYVHQTTHTAYAPAATAPRAQAYDNYSAAQQAGQQYAYTRQPATAVKAAPAASPATGTAYQENYYSRTTQASTYDQSKNYYQQPAQTSFTTPETHYQNAAKPAYSTNTSYQAAQRTGAAAQKPAVGQTAYGSYGSTSTAATTYAASTPSYSSTSSASSGLAAKSGYESALYSAATNYYQQQQQQQQKTGAAAGSWNRNKPGGFKTSMKPKPQQPKTMQLHYCDVCKISCAGPQTYREHLEGQRHKKKEAAMKAGTAQPVSRGGQNQLRCELCDVTCTGTDAYAAHIRGAKHQKVMKLHTILGKPIPSSEPVLVTTTTATKNPSTSTATTAKSATSGTKTTASTTVVTATTKKVLATPKITFVGGSQLKSATKEDAAAAAAAASSAASSAGSATTATKGDSAATPATPEKEIIEKKVSLAALQESETLPVVGHEYIEEVRNEVGKVISFQCKLCECKFNDPNAKEMHLKGRRHRLQYKKKVDPNLQVEVKPSIRNRKIQEEKQRRQAAKEEYWKRRDQEERRREEMWEMEAMQWQGGRPMMPLQGGYPRPLMAPVRRPDSTDDRHVMSKHSNIYPNETELQAVQNIVSACEKALKQASDHLADCETPKEEKVPVVKKEPEPKKGGKKKVVPKEEPKEEPKAEEKEDGADKKDEHSQLPRALKGVMRVGVLAKGLLLHGDLNVHLVVLCSDKPTRSLLARVHDNLPKQLAIAAPEDKDKYEVRLSVEEAAIIVTCDKEPKTSCTITLTSPLMRDEPTPAGENDKSKDPPDVLDRQKCLNALAALRHAKWFQARAAGLQSCVIVIRILRDLCQRVPTWAPLNEWAMELVVEKCVASGGQNMNPGDALRRVFECIASGILLPGGSGLYDPCEKEATDAAVSLTNQEREDITASAQHALRLIAFRQIHKVLGMDALPAARFQKGRFNPGKRKRRRTDSAGDGGDKEVGESKKDKKDGEESMETEAQ